MMNYILNWRKRVFCWEFHLILTNTAVAFGVYSPLPRVAIEPTGVLRQYRFSATSFARRANAIFSISYKKRVFVIVRLLLKGERAPYRSWCGCFPSFMFVMRMVGWKSGKNIVTRVTTRRQEDCSRVLFRSDECQINWLFCIWYEYILSLQ